MGKMPEISTLLKSVAKLPVPSLGARSQLCFHTLVLLNYVSDGLAHVVY